MPTIDSKRLTNTHRYSNSIKKGREALSSSRHHPQDVADFDINTNRIMEPMTNRLSPEKPNFEDSSLIVDLTAENEDLKAQIRNIKNEYEIHDMKQKRMIRELRSKLREQNMREFDALNYQPGSSKNIKNSKENVLEKVLELEKLRTENLLLKETIGTQKHNNRSMSNILNKIDTFREGSESDMQTSKFLCDMLRQIYSNISDLYSNIGMKRRSRDISKLKECLNSISNLTIERNERIPAKTQRTL
jgi:hypothetical protein